MNTNGKLKPSQLRAIAYLLECSTNKEVRKKAGIGRSTLYRWMKIPAFQKELERAKRAQFEAALGQLQSLIPEAIQGLKGLIHSSNERVSLRACVEALKATNAYGAKHQSLYDLRGFSRNGELEWIEEMHLKIVEGMLNGEISAKDVEAHLQVLDRLDDSLKYSKKKRKIRRVI